MIEFALSRREALRTIGGTLLGGVATTWVSPAAPADEPAENVPIIDAHIHLVDSRLPGAFDRTIALAPFDKDDRKGPARLAKAYQDEAKAAGIAQGLCMPRLQISDKDPLGIEDTLALIKLVRGPNLHPVGLAHPERFDQDHLTRVEEVLKQGRVKALKGYLGYLHYEPLSPGYRRYFKLAAKYQIPVILHCGDTYSKTAKLKYAHPLLVDEVAVDYPDTKFVIAHAGNPWLMDTAQVMYKNDNVWADLSAILIGDTKAFAAMEKDGVLDRTAKRIQEAIDYTEAPERFLFGSDWPLTPMVAYRDFVRRIFPDKLHAAVFRGTAKALFGL